MNQDDIIRMANEAWGEPVGKPWSETTLIPLARFAALVAAAEREAWRYAAEIEQDRKRLHEVNAELVHIFKRIRFEQGFACECGIEDATWELIETAIAKATREQQ